MPSPPADARVRPSRLKPRMVTARLCPVGKETVRRVAGSTTTIAPSAVPSAIAVPVASKAAAVTRFSVGLALESSFPLSRLHAASVPFSAIDSAFGTTCCCHGKHAAPAGAEKPEQTGASLKGRTEGRTRLDCWCALIRGRREEQGDVELLVEHPIRFDFAGRTEWPAPAGHRRHGCTTGTLCRAWRIRPVQQPS